MQTSGFENRICAINIGCLFDDLIDARTIMMLNLFKILGQAKLGSSDILFYLPSNINNEDAFKWSQNPGSSSGQ